MKSARHSQGAFTLVEIVLALAVGVVVSALAFTYLRTGSLLFAKNVSMNRSNNELRETLDKITDRVQTAVNVPVLIDATGAVTATTPAAGVYYDRLLGDTYIVQNPSGTGLAAAATQVVVQYSSSAYASPPDPKPGDVLLIAGAATGMRPMVKNIAGNPTFTAGTPRTATITLNAALGTAIAWDSTQVMTAQLIHREALIVVPSGTRCALQKYLNFETDQTTSTIVTYLVGNQSTENTPFSIVTAGLDKLLNVDFRVRATGFDNVLASKEVNGFSGYMRVQSMIPTRNRPQY